MAVKIPDVLLVDDYEINLEIIESYILRSKLPANILKAATGQEALEILEQYDLDLILLDVMLPDINGFDICRRIKSMPQYEMLPIVLLTALNDKESMLRGLDAGADEFLTKPVDSAELMLRVKNLLKLRQTSTDLQKRYRQLAQELQMATALQRSFLPQVLPHIGGLEFEVGYEPSSFVGGDFYDFLRIDERRLGVFISDIKGNGAASAMISALLKDNINKLEHRWPDPKALFAALNSQLNAFFYNTNTDYFITAFYGVFDLNANTFTYSNAGHAMPYLANEHEFTGLDTSMGFPLGVFDSGYFENVQRPVTAGDELLLYTDGIFELRLFDRDVHYCAVLGDVFADRQTPLTKKDLDEVKGEIHRRLATEKVDDDVNYIAIQIL